MKDEKILKEENIKGSTGKEVKMRVRTKKAIKRIIAIALILLGGYYLLVSGGIIPSQINFGNYSPDAKTLAIISIIIIVIGILLDDEWRAKIKNAFT